jgi:soluble lytic murein transglycosylase-like protein
LAGLTLSASAADLAMLTNGFSLRHERREQRGSSTRLFLSAGDDSYVDVPTDQITSFEHDTTPPPARATQPAPPKKAAAQDVKRIVSNAGDRHQIDADLIASVIQAESNFNPRAVSPKGAQGLMQLMPGTASQLGVTNAFEPETNVDAGTRYLRELLLRYNGDIAKALAAYNAGAHRVQQYNGVPPYRETRAYVARIIRDFNRKKLQAAKANRVGRKGAAKAPAGQSSRRASTPSPQRDRG